MSLDKQVEKLNRELARVGGKGCAVAQSIAPTRVDVLRVSDGQDESLVYPERALALLRGLPDEAPGDDMWAALLEAEKPAAAQHLYRGASVVDAGVKIQAVPLGRHAGDKELLWLRRTDDGMSYGVVAFDGSDFFHPTPGHYKPVWQRLPGWAKALLDALQEANPPGPMLNAARARAGTNVKEDAKRQRDAVYR